MRFLPSSAVSVKWSASQQWTGYFIKQTNEPKNTNLRSRNEKVHFFIKVSVAFCNFIFSADTDWEEITSLLTNNSNVLFCLSPTFIIISLLLPLQALDVRLGAE